MSRDNDSKGKTMRCSFCGKTQDEVGKLVAVPAVYAFVITVLNFVSR